MSRGSSFVVDDGCRRSLAQAGIDSIQGVFGFLGGRDLAKANIGQWRRRKEFRTDDGSVFFMKRYERPPVLAQTGNWLSHKRRGSFGSFDVCPAEELAKADILTPRVAAYGEEWGLFFEKRSFSITEKITNGEALERRLPGCFSDGSKSGLREKRAFLRRLGQWAARFHATGWRHRDFYLAHIFLTDSGQLYLIDLQRAFTPEYFAERYRRKDAAQLYYSMPRKDFSRTDRLRVYMAYAGTEVLCRRHRRFIAAVMKRVMNMARHDRRHGRVVPFEDEV